MLGIRTTVMSHVDDYILVTIYIVKDIAEDILQPISKRAATVKNSTDARLPSAGWPYCLGAKYPDRTSILPTRSGGCTRIS